ncbi:PH domain-containing protein [Candidatus Woesearchaeota archaeon]|nr:PH domain-containing protein [Candidatus Woesearchaeota archaeon]
MADIPEYIIRPNAARILIPSIVMTVFLAFLFYAGILINVTLLGISIPGSINILIAAVLGLSVIVQSLLTYLQASKMQYSIYRNRIQIEGAKQQYFMFNVIQELNFKKNFLDRMLGTGTIVIDPKTRLKAISNFDQTFVYLKQLLQYSRMQYNQ